MSDEPPRVKQVTLSPESHADLERLAVEDRRTLRAELEYLIDEETERRSKPTTEPAVGIECS